MDRLFVDFAIGAQTDRIAIGIGYDRDPRVGKFRDRNAHRASKTFRQGHCSFEIGDLGIEGRPAPIVVLDLTDSTFDSALTGFDPPVVHGVVGVEFPSQQLAVEAPQLGSILPHDLEPDNRIRHVHSFRWMSSCWVSPLISMAYGVVGAPRKDQHRRTLLTAVCQ